MQLLAGTSSEERPSTKHPCWALARKRGPAKTGLTLSLLTWIRLSKLRDKHIWHTKTLPMRRRTQLRAARSIAQGIARRCANIFWLQLCESIQTASDCGNIRGMFDGIKRAVGPTVKKTAPLKPTTGETTTIRWSDGWSTTQSSILERLPLPRRPSIPLRTCP